MGASTWEAEAGGSLWVWGQHGLQSEFQYIQECYRETLSKNQNQKQKNLLKNLLVLCVCVCVCQIVLCMYTCLRPWRSEKDCLELDYEALSC